MKRFGYTAAAVAVVALAACGKPSEVATEKMIEAQIAKDGGQAKVDLGENSVKVTSTDKEGNTTHMEMGAAPVSEADLGVPFYPGTKPTEGGSNKVTSNEGTMVSVSLHSDDAPDKVAGYYRDKLKAQAAGRQFIESSGDGSHTLILTDDASKAMTQVMVAKADKGSDIQIVASRGAK